MTDALATAAADAALALKAGRADAYDLMTLALAGARLGDMAQADALIAKALDLAPQDPSISIGLAILRRQQGRLREAVLACDAAIRLAPTYAEAWRERGVVLAAGGSAEAARASFAEAARLDPQDAGAHAGLAALAARENSAGAASEHARRALRIDPGNVVAACALARALLVTGEAAQVPGLLAPHVAALATPSTDRTLALSLLGDAYDRLGDHAEAYASYAASNRDFATVNAHQAPGQLYQTQFVEAIHAGLAALDTRAWPDTPGEQPPSAPPRHVFLIGYPRSGTTLAENILASLPGIEALEEWPTLADADNSLLTGDRAAIVAGLASFGDFDEPGLAALREGYWRRVRAAGITSECIGFVDMDPLKATRLPLIARLFPSARVLIMRRDPRDVVWSCFKTNFAVASGTLEYTSLERAARHYDAMMRLTELALAKLPLATHNVYYHQLVHDFESATRRMCAFAGLEWSDAVHRFDRTAERRGVSTASAAQVRRGLYDGTRQWEPYAQWLEPVMPILQPWIEKFGYAS